MRRPLKRSSMSSQWLKARWISSAVAASHTRMLSMVASENTTPQPKVSYGLLRSTTVMSCAGWRIFINRPKYRPAGPPPMQTIFMRLPPWLLPPSGLAAAPVLGGWYLV